MVLPESCSSATPSFQDLTCSQVASEIRFRRARGRIAGISILLGRQCAPVAFGCHVVMVLLRGTSHCAPVVGGRDAPWLTWSMRSNGGVWAARTPRRTLRYFAATKSPAVAQRKLRRLWNWAQGSKQRAQILEATAAVALATALVTVRTLLTAFCSFLFSFICVLLLLSGFEVFLTDLRCSNDSHTNCNATARANDAIAKNIVNGVCHTAAVIAAVNPISKS